MCSSDLCHVLFDEPRGGSVDVVLDEPPRLIGPDPHEFALDVEDGALRRLQHVGVVLPDALHRRRPRRGLVTRGRRAP